MSGAKLVRGAGTILGAERGFVYIDHPHHFNGSVTTSVLTTCCSHNRGSTSLFDSLGVRCISSCRRRLGRCSMVGIGVRRFLDVARDVSRVLAVLRGCLMFSLASRFRGIHFQSGGGLVRIVGSVCTGAGHSFIVLVSR